MSIAGDAARERFPFSHYAKQMSTEPGPAWNDTEGRNKNQAALLMRQINAAADEPDESYTTYCENLIAHAIGQACAQKDQEIALLKEQIRVADVAFQGLFEASAAKDKRIAELEEKQKGYTQFAFATGEAAAKRELRITELEAIIRNVDTVRDRAQRITELEKEAALLTIQLTSLTETKNIIEERLRDLEPFKGFYERTRDAHDKLWSELNARKVELVQTHQRIEELEEMNNDLTRVYANLQQAAFKLGDTNKAMAALLDRVPHKRTLWEGDRDAVLLCDKDCPACAWAKIKPTGLAGQTPSNPGGGAEGTASGSRPEV